MPQHPRWLLEHSTNNSVSREQNNRWWRKAASREAFPDVPTSALQATADWKPTRLPESRLLSTEQVGTLNCPRSARLRPGAFPRARIVNAGLETSCVRQKICFERVTAFSLPFLLKQEERAGERRSFLSISPLSDSLPARTSRGERGKMPQAFCVPNTTGRRPAPQMPPQKWIEKWADLN